MVTRDATEKQLALLSFIHLQVQDTGTPPTLRECCKAFGFTSTTAVYDIRNALVVKGLLEHVPDKARSLRITAKGLEAIAAKPMAARQGPGPTVPRDLVIRAFIQGACAVLHQKLNLDQVHDAAEDFANEEMPK